MLRELLKYNIIFGHSVWGDIICTVLQMMGRWAFEAEGQGALRTLVWVLSPVTLVCDNK